ncbi:hypothetical protein [Granulibacter bethesdensis]|uniref:hypothetical protein n=1 Tax=Granulibacter bethesdensis TaxID=364410 RepID=UPI0003F1DDB1|nr:hypothetical protein [Granulibacter bethesdensis]AHJ69335.1 Hypothetical protein GbCGDNIH2_7284 [Granulibacter bethesdensis]
MAFLEDLTVDAEAIEAGAWVRVDPRQFDDLEIRTRGFTDAFTDAQAAALDRLAVKYNGRAQIPNADQRILNAQLLRDYLILDVRNLNHRDGTPVSLNDFLDLLAKREGVKLASACWIAVGKVTSASRDDLADMEGNSVTSSATSSNGETLKTSF